MYFRLALRNAKRSIRDYLLYIFSMVVLTSILCISNCLANLGEMGAGFWTVSLPLLIVILMAVLADCIHTFLVRQRAREFATYLLLGMEKGRLSLLVLCELSLVGMVCFLAGTVLGTGIFLACLFLWQQDTGGGLLWEILEKSILETSVCFVAVEALSAVLIKRKMGNLQIVRLMQEKRRGRPLRADRTSFWGGVCAAGLLVLILMLWGITFLPEPVMYISVSVIAAPMLLSVFSFYRWLYAFLTSVRLARRDDLYQGSRLYRIAEITTGSGIGAGLNAVFGVCLIISGGSFVCGTLMTRWEIPGFLPGQRRWMGFLQIGICIIFLAVYFSILSLLQIIDLRREAGNFRLLYHMGGERSELKALLRTQIQIKLSLPTVMPFLVLGTAVPFVNGKLNSLLPASMHNQLLCAAGGFLLSFFVLYFIYFLIVYNTSLRYIQSGAGI